MRERTFGGHTLDELKSLRKSSADGAIFYMALLDAAPDLFMLAEEVETLEAVVEKLVSTLEKAAAEVSAQDKDAEALRNLRETLSDPAIREIIASG